MKEETTKWRLPFIEFDGTIGTTATPVPWTKEEQEAEDEYYRNHSMIDELEAELKN